MRAPGASRIARILLSDFYTQQFNSKERTWQVKSMRLK